MTDVDEFLEHFGVKGMKWGKRKNSNRPGPSKDAKQVAAAAKKAKKGSVKSLTNAELQAYNKRVEMERKYTQVNPNKIKKGQLAVGSILALGATVNTAIKFMDSPAGELLLKPKSGKHLRK